jgi:hypothetical protein
VEARTAWAAVHGERDENLTELLESFQQVPDEPWDPFTI